MLFLKKHKKLTDEQLVALMTKGQSSALDELYRRYYDPMYRYFYSKLGQQEAIAADFTQDLFVRLIEKAAYFDTQQNFSSWLYTIASNLCKNEYRRKSRAIIDSQKSILTLDIQEEQPHLKIKKSDFDRQLAAAVKQLQTAQQTCFRLRYEQGLTLPEISQIMDCPIGTIKSRLHYALRQLQDVLSKVER